MDGFCRLKSKPVGNHTVAIRLRKINDQTVAICAAWSEPKPGDIYLDDAQHYALACKFARDRNYLFKDEINLSDSMNDKLARQDCKCPTCLHT